MTPPLVAISERGSEAPGERLDLDLHCGGFDHCTFYMVIAVPLFNGSTGTGLVDLHLDIHLPRAPA